jgi:hypothetical protein
LTVNLAAFFVITIVFAKSNLLPGDHNWPAFYIFALVTLFPHFKFNHLGAGIKRLVRNTGRFSQTRKPAYLILADQGSVLVFDNQVAWCGDDRAYAFSGHLYCLAQPSHCIGTYP